MDRETTQRLLRESIIFLCKTYLGADAAAGFDIDSIICVSRRPGVFSGSCYDDPRPVVFKFHEFVTEDNQPTGLDTQGYGPTMGDGIWHSQDRNLSDYGINSSALGMTTRKRKAEESLISDVSKTVVTVVAAAQSNVNGVAQDLEKIKKESAWSSNDSDMSVPKSVQQTKNDTAARSDNPTADKTGSKIRDLLVGNISGAASIIDNASKGISIQSVTNVALDNACTSSTSDIKPLLRSALPSKAKESKPKQNESRGHEVSDDLLDDDIDANSSMEQSVPRTCNVCHQTFADFPTFNVHCTSEHGRFACPFCELSFPYESARERHLFEHTGEPVDEDNASDDHMSSTRANFGLDDVANRSFSNTNFDGHSAKSSSAIDLSSDNEDDVMGPNDAYYDSQMLSRRGTLSTHAIRAIAALDPARPYVCDVCRAQFEEPSDLCDHCATVHRRVPCPYCGRSFSQKASMERHQRQHTGERPYRCKMCHCSYTRKENLQTHLSRMHSMSSSGHPVADYVALE